MTLALRNYIYFCNMFEAGFDRSAIFAIRLIHSRTIVCITIVYITAVCKPFFFRRLLIDGKLHRFRACVTSSRWISRNVIAREGIHLVLSREGSSYREDTSLNSTMIYDSAVDENCYRCKNV